MPGLTFDIASYERVGPISFGMSRTDVRKQLGVPVETFMKTNDSAVPTDAFDELGIHVFYDAQDACEAVEFWRSGPTFRGKKMLNERFAKIAAWLEAIDPGAKPNASGLTSLAFGFGLYAESPEEPQSVIASVIVFKRGYYD